MIFGFVSLTKFNPKEIMILETGNPTAYRFMINNL